jgi:hypothetical protein
MPEYAWIDIGNGRKVMRRVRNETDCRSHLPAPMIQTDNIEVRSMVDGKTYTSKSSLRRSYRQAGYIEVGNEEQKPPKKAPPDRKGISDAVERAFARE